MHVSVPAYKEEWVGRYMGVTVQTWWGRRNYYGQSQERRCDVSGPCSYSRSGSEERGCGARAAVTFWLLSQNQAQTISGVTIVSGTPAQFVKTNNSMDMQATQKIAVIVNQEDSYITHQLLSSMLLATKVSRCPEWGTSPE